jgi:glycosyltransferase involved in cell wall biosynthesis
MKLLILTQKVDRKDDNLGFFHDWIAEFSKQCEQVLVICLWQGEYSLPENVKVLSLGKEQTLSTRYLIPDTWFLKKLRFIYNFYFYIITERRNYDAVFVHMNQIYMVLGGLLWRAWHKKSALWFTHKSVNISLRIAEKLSDFVFTASKESFRLKSSKMHVLGHGVDANEFNGNNNSVNKSGRFRIITVGRISPSKDYDTLIDAIDIMNKTDDCPDILVKIVGGPGLEEQQIYFEGLKDKVKVKNLEAIISFVGAVPADKRADIYRDADLFVHMSQTGSLDKVILEAMASSVVIVSCNDAVVNDVLGEYREKLAFAPKDSKSLAERIKYVHCLSREDRIVIGGGLREIVVKEHSLDALIKKIIKYL